MSLQARLQDILTRVSTEFKARGMLVNGNASSLDALTTTAKNSLVAAINELDAALDALGVPVQIADSTTSSASATWSVNRIRAEIAQVKSDLTGGASAALDTLAEFAAAIGNDANFAATITAALGHRLRVDAAQTLTAPQKLQGCQNLGIGDPETNFVAIFEAGLL